MNLIQTLRKAQADDRRKLDELLSCRAEDFTPAVQREVDDLTDHIRSRERQIRDAEEAQARSDVSDQSALLHGEVGREARAGYFTRGRDTYDRDSDRCGRRSFFSDLYNSEVHGDIQARSRFQQFQQENRAATTGSFAGLVVPQYLVEQAALVVRASRPVADSVRKLELPEQGMSLLIPKGTTGASAASQNGENTNVSNTDEVWGNVSPSVVTIAGQQDVSRQSLERGAPGLDSLVFTDLAGAYAAELDRQVIRGAGTGNEMLGIVTTSGIGAASAYGAAITAAKFQSKVAGAVNAVTTNRLLPPDTIAMHPRRWNWLLSLSDSSGRPLVVPGIAGPNNAAATGSAAGEYGQTGYTYMGLRVVVDANISTAAGTLNEDVCVVYRADDLLLWEDGDGMPQSLRFEQTLGGQLTVKLVTYGYAAFTAGRFPTAVALTGGADSTAGNGQIAPTF